MPRKSKLPVTSSAKAHRKKLHAELAENYTPPFDIIERLREEYGDVRPSVMQQLTNLVVMSDDGNGQVLERVGDLVGQAKHAGQLHRLKFRSIQAVVAAELRIKGLTWPRIAYLCGYGSQNAAYLAVRHLRERMASEVVDDFIYQDAERIDRLIATYQPAAEAGDGKAADTVLKLLDRRARLFGLDAPSKKSIEVSARLDKVNPHELTDAQLASLAAQQDGEEDGEAMNGIEHDDEDTSEA